MYLKVLQSEQKEWSDRNFGEQPAWHCMLGVVEEVGELSHAILKHEQKIRGLSDERFLALASDAIADATIYLAGLCTALGIDYSEAVSVAWDSVKLRDWRANPNGVGHGVTPQQ